MGELTYGKPRMKVLIATRILFDRNRLLDQLEIPHCKQVLCSVPAKTRLVSLEVCLKPSLQYLGGNLRRTILVVQVKPCLSAPIVSLGVALLAPVVLLGDIKGAGDFGHLGYEFMTELKVCLVILLQPVCGGTPILRLNGNPGREDTHDKS